MLKVPKRRVIELIPKGHMEVFQENFSPRHRSEPSNQAMFLKAPQMSRTSSKNYDNEVAFKYSRRLGDRQKVAVFAG